MLEKLALEYYRKGYNCTQCILMATKIEYNIPIDCNSIEMCSGIYNGLGVGSVCSVVLAGIMVISLMYKDENSIKQKRMVYVNKIYELFGSLNCGKMPKENGCEDIIYKGAEELRKILDGG